MAVIEPPTPGGSRTRRSTRIVCRLASYAIFFFTFFCTIGVVESLLVPEAIDPRILVPMGEALFVDLLMATAYIFVSIFLEERNPAAEDYRRRREPLSKPIPREKSA